MSIAEVLTTRAQLICHDNSTRGLDSSTALEYVRALRIATDITRQTTVCSIYQASESLWKLFDKCSVLYDGQQIYFGPISQASDYFKSLGYEPHDRQTTPDFLVSVTDPRARIISEGSKNVPHTAEEFAERFRASKIFAAEQKLIETAKASLADERVNAFKDSAQAEKAKHLSKGSSYNISYWMQVKLSCRRRYQLVMGDLPTVMIILGVNIFQALIIGSVFYAIPQNTAGFFSFGGVIFFALLFNSLTGLAEIPAMYAQRPILVRQRRYRMTRPSADAIAQTLVDLPKQFLTVLVFDLILYWLTGLAPSADQFFIFLLFTCLGTIHSDRVNRSLTFPTKFPSL